MSIRERLAIDGRGVSIDTVETTVVMIRTVERMPTTIPTAKLRRSRLTECPPDMVSFFCQFIIHLMCMFDIQNNDDFFRR